MKNIKVYPKDWMQLHPYQHPNSTDLYYTNIANQIFNIMQKTGLASSFEGDEIKQVCLRMSAYFEDVISQTNIWRTFITAHKEAHGTYLPFYTTSDNYYEDEVNLEDIRFLLWHYTQQYHGFRKSTFVNPDNTANEETGKLIYQLFCDEWTTAPENERMQELFSLDTSYSNRNSYEEILCWFHYNSYLFPEQERELSEHLKDLLGGSISEDDQLDLDFMEEHKHYAYVNKLSLLPLTSPEWLCRLIPEDHKDAKLFKECSIIPEDSYTKESKQENYECYERFKKVADGKLVIYTDNAAEAIDLVDNKMEIELDELYYPEELQGQKLAICATPEDGVLIIHQFVEAIKDENNPFYDEKVAKEHGLSFFMSGICTGSLLKLFQENGMLAEVQTKSLISPERGKAIIHENWKFLSHYFIREYPL